MSRSQVVTHNLVNSSDRKRFHNQSATGYQRIPLGLLSWRMGKWWKASTYIPIQRSNWTSFAFRPHLVVRKTSRQLLKWQVQLYYDVVTTWSLFPQHFKEWVGTCVGLHHRHLLGISGHVTIGDSIYSVRPTPHWWCPFKTLGITG
jgi:hypothetical protein